VRTAAASAILEAIALARQGAIAEAQARLTAAAAAVRAAAARLEDAELGPVLRELEDVSKQLAQLVVPAPQVGLEDASPARGPVGGPRSMRPAAPASAPAPVARKLRRAQEKASATVTGEAL
jgi:hypothetical protein